jgi:hypothetical protein
LAIVSRAAVALFVGSIVIGCQAVQLSPSAPPSVASPTVGPTPFPTSEVSLADAASCPTTKGAPGPADAQERFFGWGSSYGNGELWVGALWPDGIIFGDPRFLDSQGRVGMKFGWWHTVAGKLQITGHRRDATAPPVIGDVPDGYGQTGFQASGVTFPTEGCWEITGTIGSSSLTFLTFVIRVPTARSP